MHVHLNTHVRVHLIEMLVNAENLYICVHVEKLLHVILFFLFF